VLKANQVTKTIDGKAVLEEISFTLEKGSITALLGRNGAGKTTLIRTLVGILMPDHGTVTYDGVDVHEQPEIKQKILYVPDSTNLLNSYTVKEIAAFYKATYEHFDETYFYALLDRFNLPSRRIRSYSRGMKALLAMILAFSAKADYIILDEPTNGKILLFPAFSKTFLPCVIVCCSLLGGVLFSSSSNSLISFYTAAVITGIITYIIMKRLINLKLAWNGK